MSDLDVYGVGTEVLIGDHVPAVITAICIRSENHVTYECAWWDGNQRHCDWIESEELAVSTGFESLEVGFKAV